MRLLQGILWSLLLNLFVSGLGQPSLLAQEPSARQSAAAAASAPEASLDGRDGRNLALDQFRPRSTVRTPQHHLTRAKFPAVDVHVHPRIRLHNSPELLDAYVHVMDKNNIAVSVSLDGQLGENLAEHIDYLWTKHKDRFAIFANIDWRGTGKLDDYATWDCHRPDFGRRMAAALADARKQGAVGLKLFKRFGLTFRNPDGSLIKIDDPRWDPIWRACGELGMPVIIHTSDPAAFFMPIDENNERWEELHRHPEWSFYGKDYPSRNELLAARNRVIAKHPKTIFFGAHMGNSPEDLARVGEWLDTYPNFNVETAARIGELGRQPYTARRFFIKYADRIMFGTDGPRSNARLLPHWQFLETADEYFPYSDKPFPPQGLWNIYGIFLPDDVLRKVYYENANRLIPGVKEKWEKYHAKQQAAKPE